MFIDKNSLVSRVETNISFHFIDQKFISRYGIAYTMDLTISPYIIWIIYFTIGERNVAHVLMTIWFSSQVPCGAGTKIPSKMCSCANRGLISPIITHLTRDICSRFQVWNIYQHLARKSLKCRYSKYTIHGASHYRYLIHYNKYTYIYIYIY